jgi:hypothetical protein
MRTPYTREEIVDILDLVADRLRARDRWEYEAWYCRAYKKTRGEGRGCRGLGLSTSGYRKHKKARQTGGPLGNSSQR